MSFKNYCRGVSLARVLPFCAALFLAGLACLAAGGRQAFRTFNKENPPVYFSWKAPEDTSISMQAAFIFEPYSTTRAVAQDGEERNFYEYLMTTDWNTFMGVCFTDEGIQRYGRLIENMHSQARDGGDVQPITLKGVVGEMDGRGIEDFNALIGAMGYNADDGAISHHVLYADRAPFLVVSDKDAALFFAFAASFGVGLVLFLLTLAGVFQTSLRRNFEFSKGGNGHKGNAEKKADYAKWRENAVRAGDLWMGPDMIVFHSFARVVCIKPRRLAKALGYRDKAGGKKASGGKGRYMYLYTDTGRRYRVLTGKKGKTAALQYIFSNYPSTVSL